MAINDISAPPFRDLPLPGHPGRVNVCAGAVPRRLTRGSGAILLALGLAGAALTLYLGLESPVFVTRNAVAGVRTALVAMYVLAGLYVWRRRPSEPFGPVIVLLGLTFVLTDPIGAADPVAHSIGRLVNAAWVGLWIFAFLVFPAGRLGSRADRAIVGFYAVTALALWPLVALFANTVPPAGVFTSCGSSCPDNGLQVTGSMSGFGHAASTLATAAAAVALVATVLSLAARMRSAVKLEQKTVAPVLFAAGLVIVGYILNAVHPTHGTVHDIHLLVSAAAAFAVPIAFVVGPLRGELFVSRSLWRGLASFDYVRFSTTNVEELCRRALGDSSLRLAVAVAPPSSYHDLDGAAIPRGVASSAGVTRIERDRNSYVLLHDPRLSVGYSALVERVGALAVTLVEYGQMLRDVVFSRRRLAEAESEERARLERDLHDGAQQWLLAIQLKLGELARSTTGSPLGAQIEDVADDTAAAAEEIRRISHGIYPSVLVQQGVADAVRGIPVPPAMRLYVIDKGAKRLGAPVERALYFSVVECVQNATKHAQARSVIVTLEPGAGTVDVSVEDDGRGFDATASRGAGLTSIRDRIESVGGTVAVTSTIGHGTLVDLRVPA
jgi:signal transduction histidine kinase